MLHDICRQLRIDLEYYDIWGQPHQAFEDTVRAILASLGLPAADDETLLQAWNRKQQQRARALLEPVTVALHGQPIQIAVHGPTDVTPPPEVRIAVYPEQGGEMTATLPLTAIDKHDHGWTATVTLPWPLPLGYHDLTIHLSEAAEPSATQRLIVAPAHAWEPPRLANQGRMAGIAISLYGLRSARNWGVGDFTDLAAFTGWAARELGVSLVALNPLHAIHNREPYNTSPYLPLTSFYRNFLYLDIEQIDGFAGCPAARSLLESPATQALIARLRASELVDYEGAARLKRAFLRLLFREFLRREWTPQTDKAREFRQFLASEGEFLHRFATYCALDEVLHARDRSHWTWHDWPAEYQDPDSEATTAFARQYWRRVLFHQWVQWQIGLQLAPVQQAARDLGMDIGLYHDLALATDRCGADLWAYRTSFAQGCRVGSPPDDFSPEGQDWSFPPPQPEALRADGYRLFIETIRKNSQHGGALRIDHFMRFYRLFWIPDGMPAREGTYVREHFEELMRILALESVRGQFLVVGEDLGTCPPEVREGMARYGILSYKLFYFEKGHGGLLRPPAEFPHLSLVSSTTHDLPTLAGFWAGRDIEARKAAGLLPDEAWYERQQQERREEKHRMVDSLIRDGFLPHDFPREAATWTELTGDLHNAVIGWLCSTPSALMLLNQEDLTKETEQQNLPGTTAEYPNWKRKMKLSLEELGGGDAAGFAAMYHDWLARTGRSRG